MYDDISKCALELSQLDFVIKFTSTTQVKKFMVDVSTLKVPQFKNRTKWFSCEQNKRFKLNANNGRKNQQLSKTKSKRSKSNSKSV